MVGLVSCPDLMGWTSSVALVYCPCLMGCPLLVCCPGLVDCLSFVVFPALVGYKQQFSHLSLQVCYILNYSSLYAPLPPIYTILKYFPYSLPDQSIKVLKLPQINSNC